MLGADESGMRAAGSLWLHVAVSPLPSWLGVHRKRGREAFDEFGLPPEFDGTLVHDGFVSHKSHFCRHALCNARHLCELKFEAEENEQAWAEGMSGLLCRAPEDTRNHPEGLPREISDTIRRGYDGLIKRAWKARPFQTARRVAGENSADQHGQPAAPAGKTGRRGAALHR